MDCPTCGPADQILLYKVEGWHIVRCASCGLAMVNPRRRNALQIYEDDRYFSDDRYYYDYAGNKKAYQKGFRSKLSLISKFCPQRGKLLDVGAAYGFFMEEASRFSYQPFAVELSKAQPSALNLGDIFAIARKSPSVAAIEHFDGQDQSAEAESPAKP